MLCDFVVGYVGVDVLFDVYCVGWIVVGFVIDDVDLGCMLFW